MTLLQRKSMNSLTSALTLTFLAPLSALAFSVTPAAHADENQLGATPAASVMANSATSGGAINTLSKGQQAGGSQSLNNQPQGDDHNFDHNRGPRVDDQNFGLATPQLIVVLIALIAAIGLAYRAGRKARDHR
jgi:predicted outer membrane repeat protein